MSFPVLFRELWFRGCSSSGVGLTIFTNFRNVGQRERRPFFVPSATAAPPRKGEDRMHPFSNVKHVYDPETADLTHPTRTIEMIIPIRLGEKRICRGCRTGESYDSDCRTLSSRPTVNISASLYLYQSRSQSVA